MPRDSAQKYELTLTASEELELIAKRAQAETSASGAAIALLESETGQITCRASSGSNAPEVGTALKLEGSFTGQAVHSGKQLRCDDSERDPRIDEPTTTA